MADKGVLNRLRWKAFKWLSAIGWAICPEPQRTALQRVMPTWQRIEDTSAQVAAAIRKGEA